MRMDFPSGGEDCRKKDEMLGTPIFRIDLQDEGLPRIRVSWPTPHNSPLTLVLLEDQRS
jgi:hypothetical protein